MNKQKELELKKLGLWGILGIAVIAVIAIVSALQFGERSPMLVSGRIKVAPAVMEAAKASSIMFITLFDADSPAPMPYGALRETLKGSIGPEGYEFYVTPERINMMAQGRPQPTAFRVKARLDMDGQGGPDQPGDIVGKIDRVAVGSDNVEIIIQDVVQ